MTRRPRYSLLWIATVLVACGRSDEEWGHPSPVLDLPEEFDVVGRPSARAPVAFPARPVEASVTWELHRGGDVSQIVLTRHPGSTRPEQVWAAVNSLRDGNRSWTLEGPDARQVAGRPAWEWTASVPSPQGPIWAVQRTLVVAFPDSTWVASFWGQHPEWQDPERQDRVLASFRIPTPARPIPKHPIIAVAILALVGGVVWLRSRPRAKPAPARPLPIRDPVHSGRPPPGTPADRGTDSVVTRP